MRTTEHYLSLLAEGGNTGFWSYDIGTQRLAADAASRRLLGCAGTAAPTLQQLLAGVREADRAALQQDILRACSARDGFAREFALQDGDPARLCMRGRWSATAQAGAGELLCLVERSTAAAPHAPAGRALQPFTSLDEAPLARAMAEACFDGAVLTRNGLVVDANAQLAALLGVPRASLIGQPVTNYMLPGERERALQTLQKGGDSFTEYAHLHPDGKQLVLEVNSRELVQDGEVLRISVLRNITAQRQNEQALEQLQGRFARMLESNVVGMFVAGEDGEIFEANTCFLNMLGLQREALEAGQLNWKQLTAPEFLEPTLQQVRMLQQSGGGRPYEKEYLHSNGSRVATLAALSLLSTDPMRGVVSVVDISALKSAQKALLQTNARLLQRTRQAERTEAAKTLFLSSVSHELRTPLHTVLGHVHLLRKKASGDELQQLNVVEHSSRQLLKLIDDLLEFNHSAIAPEQLQPEVVVLDGFLANLESIGSAAAAASGNQFVSRLGGDLPSSILVDQGRLEQVLRILIDNACKYTDDGLVLFSLSRVDDPGGAQQDGHCSLRFSVKDTGRGIETGDQQRIFDPLNRGSHSSDRPGLGLGLAIAAHWIERMGSDFVLASAPGIGSDFSFVLRLEAGFDGAQRQRAPQPQAELAALAAISAVAFPPLPAADLETLGKLLDLGRLGRLRTWAQELESRCPEHQGAARLLAELAGNAEVGALERLHRHWTALPSSRLDQKATVPSQGRVQQALTVAVVDDDAPTLHLICAILQTQGYRALPFETAPALSLARRTQTFDALVLDLSMPDQDGFELLYELAGTLPLEPVIICSGQPDAIIRVAASICSSLGFRVLGTLSKPFANEALAALLAPLNAEQASTGSPA